MSAHRDPDRILRAWLEQMPSEAPDRALAAVLQATEAASQLRAWPRIGPWRPNMNRISLVAAVALIALALVGGAVILTGGQPRPTTALPTPTPTTASTPTAAANVTTPVALRATWVAQPGARSGSGSEGIPVARLEIAPASLSVAMSGSSSFFGQAVAGGPEELAFRTTIGSGCQPGDLGRYRYDLASDGAVPNSDGTRLRLTAIADSCPARQAVLEREWVRAIDADNAGGRGVAVNFDPMFMVTLPHKTFAAQAGPDGLTLDASDGSAFVATRNPWGWTEPCSARGGAKLELAPTAAAFATYLAGLPGMTVQQEAVEIDGRPAVHLVVPTTVTDGCQATGIAGRINEWTTSDPASTGGWFITQGDTDSIYLVEVDGNLFLLQWLEPTISKANELAVLSTVHFVSTLSGT